MLNKWNSKADENLGRVNEVISVKNQSAGNTQVINVNKGELVENTIRYQYLLGERTKLQKLKEEIAEKEKEIDLAISSIEDLIASQGTQLFTRQYITLLIELSDTSLAKYKVRLLELNQILETRNYTVEELLELVSIDPTSRAFNEKFSGNGLLSKVYDLFVKLGGGAND